MSEGERICIRVDVEFGVVRQPTNSHNRGCESLCVSWAGPRGIGFGSFPRCFLYVVSVVTPEAVSLCGELRCMQGGYGRRTFVMCYLVVSGLPFWPSSGIGDQLLLDLVVSPSGRVRDAWVPCGWGLGGVFGLVWGGC